MIIAKHELEDAKQLLEVVLGLVMEESPFSDERYRGMTNNGRLVVIRELSQPVEDALEVFCVDKEVNNNITSMYYSVRDMSQGDSK